MAEHPDSAKLKLTDIIGAKSTTGPRISLTDLKNNIESVRYLIPGPVIDMEDSHPLHRMVVCFITTWSGFIFIGKAAPLSADNFDREKASLFAYEDAVQQMWPAYALVKLEKQREDDRAMGQPHRGHHD